MMLTVSPRLLERHRRSKRGKRFSPWAEAAPLLQTPGTFKYQLQGCDGFVHVYPNLLSEQERTQIQEELLGFRQTISKKEHTAFRKHRVQCQWEPRIQFMMHECATEDTIGAPQPGYSYAKNVVMKALPLKQFPVTEAFTDRMEELCRDPDDPVDDENGFFNIGVHALLYRGGRDAMGFHADDDQDESLIVSAIVTQDGARIITFRPKGKWYPVEYQLHLNAGDAYSMDGVMQESYLHGVPKSTSVWSEGRRLALLFRRGRYQEFQTASGAPCTVKDFAAPPPPKPYTFGWAPGLQMGHIYTREQLVVNAFHNLRERGVSGNQKVGCNAIVVSGKKNQEHSVDFLDGLVYAATSKEGALAMKRSYENGTTIRVFRSSTYASEYRAPIKEGAPTQYRFDGLYKILDVIPIETTIGTVFKFDMARKELRHSPRPTKRQKTVKEFCVGFTETQE